MYRALALAALQDGGIALTSEPELEDLARESDIELRPAPPTLTDPCIHNRVILDGDDVTQAIRTNEVAQAASRIPTIAGVRKILVAAQQNLGAEGGVVMEGRRHRDGRYSECRAKNISGSYAGSAAERHRRASKRATKWIWRRPLQKNSRARQTRHRARSFAAGAGRNRGARLDNTAMDAEETARLIVQLAYEREIQLSKVRRRNRLMRILKLAMLGLLRSCAAFAGHGASWHGFAVGCRERVSCVSERRLEKVIKRICPEFATAISAIPGNSPLI